MKGNFFKQYTYEANNKGRVCMLTVMFCVIVNVDYKAESN